jgi:hypothetical protein
MYSSITFMKSLALGHQDWVHAMRDKECTVVRFCAFASANVATIIM